MLLAVVQSLSPLEWAELLTLFFGALWLLTGTTPLALVKGPAEPPPPPDPSVCTPYPEVLPHEEAHRRAEEERLRIEREQEQRALVAFQRLLEAKKPRVDASG